MVAAAVEGQTISSARMIDGPLASREIVLQVQRQLMTIHLLERSRLIDKNDWSRKRRIKQHCVPRHPVETDDSPA